MEFFAMNLQVFATTQTTVTPALSAEMKTYYEDRLIDSAEPNLVYDQFADKYPIPKGRGKNIEFRKYAPLDKAMTELTKGVTPAGNKLSVSTITATVHQYGDFIEISDQLDLTAIDPNLEQATMLLGNQAGRTLDSITRNVVHAGTNVIFAPTADGTENLSRDTITADSVLTIEVLQTAVAKLREMNAPTRSDGLYVCIMHPNAAMDLMKSVGWAEWHKYTNAEAMYRGEIGTLAGCRIVETTEAQIFEKAGDFANGSDGTKLSVYTTMVIGANAYATTEVQGGGLRHIVKQLGSSGTSDPLDQRATTGWKCLKTAERLTEEYMIRIEHACKTNPTIKGN